MGSLCIEEKFLYIYDGISNNNPNFGHNIEEFWKD